MQNQPLITRSEIRERCGTNYYSRGKRYFEEGRVTFLKQDVKDPTKWQAIVEGTREYAVAIKITEYELDAHCTCPIFDSIDWCKHVAAVLMALASHTTSINRPAQPPLSPIYPASSHNHKVRQLTSSPPSTQREAVDVSHQLIQLFRQTAEKARKTDFTAGTETDLREWLKVEFICRPQGSSFRIGEHIDVEMKVGPKMTYVVKNIRAFLGAIEQRKKQPFTQKFTYDPMRHRFQPEDIMVFHELRAIIQEEAIYRNLMNPYAYSSSSGNDRALMISPMKWKSLYPLLLKTTTTVIHDDLTGAMQVVNEAPPITATVTSTPTHAFVLQVSGLENVLVLPSYGCAISETTFHLLDQLELEQLTGMQRIINSRDHKKIPIKSEAIDAVINELIPGFKRLGKIKIDAQISRKIVEAPLEAKVYLDRYTELRADSVYDVLSANLEFHYGGHHIQPFAANESTSHESQPIIIRDVTQEDRMLQLFKQSGFKRHGAVAVLTGEEEIYDFLFNKLSTLQEYAQVYATSAVDALIQPPSSHPHSRLEIDEKMNWLDVSFDMGDLDENEIIHVLQSLIEKKKYHRLKNGAYVSLEGDAYAQMGQLFDNLGIRSSELKHSKRQHGIIQHDSENGLKLRLPSIRALSLLNTEHETESVKLGRSLRKWLDHLRNPDHLEVEVPTSLLATLREYQTLGFRWMRTLAQYGFGGILADDMGLGKTIQSIAYLLSVQPTTHPALIVCPASLTFNWLSEIERFAPELKAIVVTGDPTERQAILATASQYHVLITSYPLLMRDAEDYQALPFSSLILDEAQTIKNHQTQTAQAVYSLKSEVRFALTGTPVENSLDDLWSIFHAIFPALLGSRASFSSLTPEMVMQRIRPFVLRRLKRDVLTELPDKIETLQTAELTIEQKKLYLAYLSKLQEETKQDLANDGFQKGRIRILAGLTRLRQICCHPALCVENYQGESGKLAQLLELVDEYLNANQRILIFSQFTSMLHLISEELTKLNLHFFYLDGQTPAKERLALCQSFNEGNTPIFLISLKAGGTGLNLTGADTVILYDLWWNPAVEQQATDRAHRIGQKRTVQVIRMVTKGTIEEKIHQLQEHKRDLIDQVVQANNQGLGALTEEDVRALLMI